MFRNFAVLSCLALCNFLFSGNVARADGSGDLEIEITAPVTAIDATSTPNTVTVLGLTVVVPASALSGGDHGTSNSSGKSRSDSGSTGGSNDGSNGDNGGTTTPLTLSSIQLGTLVKIRLASDAAPLTAVELSVEGAYDTSVKIHAPLQAVDTTANTITVLGLGVDISTATVEGSNDDDTQTTPATPTTLTVGQSAELVLDPAKLPALVALKIEVKNFTNQVGVELDDNQGNEIENQSGNDTSVSVTQSVKVKDSLTGKTLHKTVNLHTTTTSSTLNLAGLAPGRARITITRNGKTFHKTITVSPNSATTLKVKVGH